MLSGLKRRVTVIEDVFTKSENNCRALFYGRRWAMVAVLDSAWRLFPAKASHHDFSNARTPQNRDSYGSVEVGCVQLFFEPTVIRLNGFYAYLELRRDFRGCFAIAK
jgi:hypothetical protein